MKKLCGYTCAALVMIQLLSCNKQSDSIATAQLNEYLPLQVGKYIHYRLDSTRFIDFGQRDTIVSYDAKDVVEEELMDNAGRTAFRVVRYLRDLESVEESQYQPSLTYLVTPSRQTIELTENNLRYMKLALPVTEGFNWHGNSYLPTTPFYERYQFSNDEDMDTWDYTYQQVNQSTVLNDIVYDSTVTVLQVADSSNVPIEFPEGLAYRNYWIETYAKNIGLIYKEVVMWEYQPPNSGNPGFRSGFGLKMTIIDHN